MKRSKNFRYSYKETKALDDYLTKRADAGLKSRTLADLARDAERDLGFTVNASHIQRVTKQSGSYSIKDLSVGTAGEKGNFAVRVRDLTEKVERIEKNNQELMERVARLEAASTRY